MLYKCADYTYLSFYESGVCVYIYIYRSLKRKKKKVNRANICQFK